MAVRKVAKVAKAAPPTSITLVAPASDPELSASAKRMLTQAQQLEVVTAEDYEAAACILQTMNVREKEVAAKKAELWDPLAKLTKSVQNLFNPPLKVLDQAKRIVSEKMGTYAQEQRNIALRKQQQADEEAEEARKKLLAKAERAADDGNHARAYVLEARAASVTAPTIEEDTPAVAGLHLRERWLFEVTDEAEVPAEYRSVDEAKIRAAVNTYKDKLEIPGVRIWSTLKPQG